MSFLLNSLILRSDQSQGETKIQNYINFCKRDQALDFIH